MIRIKYTDKLRIKKLKITPIFFLRVKTIYGELRLYVKRVPSPLCFFHRFAVRIFIIILLSFVQKINDVCLFVLCCLKSINKNAFKKKKS